MRTVVQRVSSASVTVEGKVTGSINKGLLLLLGIHRDDTEAELSWMCDKILKLRVFEDEKGKMNRSLMDIKGEILIVSQFTLYGDARKGTRASFIDAARPEIAEPMYERMKELLYERSGLKVQTGIFGASMEVHLINDGPVTLILEK